jgi:hypothetical protein
VQPSVTTCKDFGAMLEHVGHRLAMVSYGPLQGQEVEVAVECMTCDQVLFSQSGQKPEPVRLAESKEV